MKMNKTNRHCFFGLILFLALTGLSCKDAEKNYIINGSNVNLRSDASLKGRILVQLNKNEPVQFLGRSDVPEKIGENNDYWFKVKTQGNMTGWVYGAYIKEVEADGSPENNSPDKDGAFWEDNTGSIPGKIPLICTALAFKSKKELLDTPLSKRYKCEEYTFSKKEKAFFEKNGFYLKSVDPKKLQYVNFDDMVDLYFIYTGAEKPVDVLELTELDKAPQYSLAPLFISADYMLHIYHLIFMRMVEDIETNKFYPIIKNLTEALLKESISKYKNEKDGRLKEVYKTVAAYFSIPAGLMDISVKEKDILDLASGDLGNINSASTVTISSITGEKEDFTQYKPRGHYNKSEILKKYFKVMMWYGRIFFPVKQPVHGLVITEMLSRKVNLQKWESIYIPTTYLVGKSDDLDVYDYKKAAEEVFGGDFRIQGYPESSKLKEFVEYIKNLRDPKIISRSSRNSKGKLEPEKAKEKSKGFRFMGQRFIPDSYIFTQFTSPRVGSDAAPRNMPRGIDVMAVLGSQEAEGLLKEELKRIPRFQDEYKKIKKEFEGYGPDVYGQNIYWIWLDSFRSLFEKPGSGLPSFIYTPEWRYRLLLAAHGSWAELRHDTILYGKQSGAELGGPEAESVFYAGQPKVPMGYVEPNPLFFSKMKLLTAETSEKLKKAGVLTDEYKVKLNIFNDVIKKLDIIAQKEVSAEKIFEDDFLYIANCTKELSGIVLPGNVDFIEQKYKKMAVIADVHTDFFSGNVLEVGVGLPREIFMFVKDTNGSRVCIGYTFSYYEFPNPMNSRMTDEEWRTKAYNSSMKKYMSDREPGWLRLIPFVD